MKNKPLDLKMKKCRYCLSTENLTVDHKIPKAKGGTNVFSNLQCLCERCNKMKSDISHKGIMRLFRWFDEINESRRTKNKKPYGMKKYGNKTNRK